MKATAPLRAVIGLLSGSFLQKGLRFGIRARFIVIVAIMFFAFASLLFWNFSNQIRRVFVTELHRRVSIQVDYLSGYGIVLIGNQNRENLESLLQPLIRDSDLEYLVIQSQQGAEISTVYSNFRDIKLRSQVLDTQPEFPRGEPVKTDQEFQGVTVIHTAIPIYQQVVDVASLSDIETLFEDEGNSPTLDESLAQGRDLGYDDKQGDLGGDSAAAPAPKPQAAAASGPDSKQLAGWILYGVSTSSANAQIRQVQAESLSFSMAFLFAMVLVIWIFIALGFVPLMRMAEVSQEIARGDLSVNVPVDADDEIGDLAQSFNRMIDQLRLVIERIQTTSRRLQAGEGQIGAATEQVREGATSQSAGIDSMLRSVEALNSSIQEISANVNQLTESAEESSASVYELNETIKEVDTNMEHLSGAVTETVQIINESSETHKQNVVAIENLRRGTEETATSMSEIDMSITEIRDHSKASAESAKSMFDDARVGKQAVDKTVDGLDAISQFSSQMTSVIGDLERKSSEIATIIDVIYDVADQTNLLALNAAIIAAQAGEKGRSFAVVAVQIKELSNRTVESIEQINSLIADVQAEVAKASESMKGGDRIVGEGVIVARRAGESLNTILQKAEKVLTISQEIERSTSEHARGAHQVRQASEQIKDMVGHIHENIRAQEERNSVLREAAGKMKNISVHVKGTTREQSAGSRLIKESIERITAMVHQIGDSVRLQQQSTGGVVTGADDIRQIAAQTLESMRQLDDVVKVLGEQIQVLTEVAGEFKIKERS